MRGREFEIIERYFSGSISHAGEQVVLGPGDDCAILRVPPGKELVLSTDTLVTGVHFPEGSSGTVVAHRSLVANLSDLAAMGAECLAFTLALTMPEENTRWLEEFSTTLDGLVRRYAIPLVGGNLARGELSVTISVLGTLPAGKALRRSDAREGDDVYVSGTLGDAAGGLRLIARGEAQAGQLVDRYLYPEPRLELGRRLLDVASAAIDISDGLAADLDHICESSRAGAEVTVDRIPLSQPLVRGFNLDGARQLAVGGGDDYELCFTASQRQRGAVETIARQLEVPISRIGSIVAGDRTTFLDSDGKPVEFTEHGYQHFHEA